MGPPQGQLGFCGRTEDLTLTLTPPRVGAECSGVALHRAGGVLADTQNSAAATGGLWAVPYKENGAVAELRWRTLVVDFGGYVRSQASPRVVLAESGGVRI